RNAIHPHSPVAPRLPPDPRDRVDPVGAFVHEGLEPAVRRAAAPDVRDDDDVPGFDRTERLEAGVVLRDEGIALVVGRALEEHWIATARHGLRVPGGGPPDVRPE